MPALRTVERIAAAATVTEVAELTAAALRVLLGAERAALLRASADLLRPIDADEPAMLLEAEVAAAAGALQIGEPRFVTHSSGAAAGGELAPSAALAVPLVSAGSAFGVAVVGWESIAPTPDAATLAAARAVCAAAALALAREAAEQHQSRFDDTDPLTGAASRQGLAEVLGELTRRGTPYALVLLDIDGFTKYNASNGRDAGNRLLIALAGMVGQECRDGDLVARSGPDEFALVLPGSTATAGTAAARRIVSAVGDWGHEDEVTATAGVAASIADARADALALARTALDAARRNGGGVGVA